MKLTISFLKPILLAGIITSISMDQWAVFLSLLGLAYVIFSLTIIAGLKTFQEKALTTLPFIAFPGAILSAALQCWWLVLFFGLILAFSANKSS